MRAFRKKVVLGMAIILASAGVAVGAAYAAEATRTITFGMTTPLTGNAASLGLDGLKGAQVLIKHINDMGGVNGNKWDVLAQDDALDPQKSVANIQYLISEKKVFAIWGGLGSGQTAALPVINQTKTPFLFTYGINRGFTDPLQATTFMVIPPAYEEQKAMSNYLGESLQGNRVFGLLPINSVAGEDFTRGFKDGKAGKWVKSVQPFESTATTWQTQLVALRAAGVTDVMIHGSDAWTAKIIREAKQLGMQKVKFYANTSAATSKFFELAGPNAEGTIVVTFSAPVDDLTSTGIKEFLAAFAKYEPGYKPGTTALHSWVTGLIIAEAMRNVSGPVTQEKLIASLEGLKNFATGDIMAPVSFSKDNHLGTRAQVRILQATDGRWKPLTGWIGAQK